MRQRRECSLPSSTICFLTELKIGELTVEKQTGGKLRILIESHQRILRVCALLTGAFFVVAGICRGEAAQVWNKAVRICLECIGIG